MILVTNSGEDVEGNFTAQGFLPNETTYIQIREVKQWGDGKIPAFGVICGYEFFIDDRSIAAVQSSLDTFQKKLHY